MSVPDAEFSLEDEKIIIHTVADHPEVWNVKNPNYYRKDVKERAYKKVFDELGGRFPGKFNFLSMRCQQITCTTNSELPVSKIIKKWGNLRTQFTREHNKVLSSQRSGQGTDDLYVPKWKHYSDLLYLRSACIQRPSTSNLRPGEVTRPQESQVSDNFACYIDLFLIVLCFL